MPKKVRMDDIAMKLGVSKNTVSLALRNMPVISEQTKELVHVTAKEMGYIYDKKNKPEFSEQISPKSICLLLHRSIRDIEFFSLIQFGIEKEARKNHINVILYYIDDQDINETPLCIRQKMVNGIITLGQFSKETLLTVLSFALPTVVVDMYNDSLSLDYVLSDNISGAFKMTQYLITKGHSRIGFFGNVRQASSFYDRYQGYLKALQSNGLCLEQHLQITEANQEPGVALPCNINDLPTAFFCVNDAHASELIKALKALHGDKIRDIYVAGFDNIQQVLPRPKATMHVEKELMGETAVRRLIHIMHYKDSVPEKILISTKLIKNEE